MSLLAPSRFLGSPGNGRRHVPKLVRYCSSRPRDHRELAQNQKLFATSIYSPGSPLFLPNGADMMNKLTACLRAHYPQFGFREVITPNIYKRSLWEKSGHWENYASDMFQIRGHRTKDQTEDAELGEDEVFGLKPMNCPGHCLLFASEPRSHRDLPIRYADFSSLHRNEISGALTGLTRVRRFHQDDGHIFCQASQIEQEIKQTMAFIDLVYSEIFNMPDYRLVLSTRPERDFIGLQSEWDRAEEQLKSALGDCGRKWSVSAGDGAFYGPKIDVILKDGSEKEHQTATIQLDFQLPQRFGLRYRSGKGETNEEVPVLIHRAVMGSLERFLALLLEHYNGTYPFWISPYPVTILSVSSNPEVLNYVDEVAATLSGRTHGKPAQKAASRRPAIFVHKDTSARPLGKKIHEAKKAGYNFVIVVGQQDVEQDTIALQLSNQYQPKKTLEMLNELVRNETGSRSVSTNSKTVRRFFNHLQDDYL